MDRGNEERVPPVNVDAPNSARMYDYYLGGSANFAVDREAAEAGLQAMPYARHYARANRSFLGRAVAHLSACGIDQFLDLGSGIPTVGNVHEIAHRNNPAAAVAYVDHEPVAVSHARQLIAGSGHRHVSMTHADISRPEQVLTAPGVTEVLDLTRPVAVLAVAIIPFVPDNDEARAVLAAYRDAGPPGSALAFSHISALNATQEQVTNAEAVMARTPTPVRWRTRSEIAELLAGYELVAPGIVPLDQWRPERVVSDAEAAQANGFGAVGFVSGA